MTHSVGVTPSSIGAEEEERRLRMAQAVGEEDAVSERLTQRKRKKRKTKRHSSETTAEMCSNFVCVCPLQSSHEWSVTRNYTYILTLLLTFTCVHKTTYIYTNVLESGTEKQPNCTNHACNTDNKCTTQ